MIWYDMIRYGIGYDEIRDKIYEIRWYDMTIYEFYIFIVGENIGFILIFIYLKILIYIYFGFFSIEFL